MAEHLAECDRCRNELVEAGRVLRDRRSASWRGWVPLALGAAAVLALLVVQPWEGGEPTSTSRFRNEGVMDRGQAIEVVQPDAEARMSGDSRFVWRSVDPGAVYRFTLVSDDGGHVFSTTTTDTALTLPEGVALAGDEFHWVVDALLPDGRTATSGAHNFHSP